MSERVLITGPTCSIAQAFIKLLPTSATVVEAKHSDYDFGSWSTVQRLASEIKSCEKIVLLHGVVGTKRFLELSESEVLKAAQVNLWSNIQIIEHALNHNPSARIVVMGSESGVKGSFDIPYALTKAALHKYVEERKILNPQQQLVCIAPSTIEDAGITLRRKDQDNVKKSIQSNPKGRGLSSAEVAELIHFLLFVDRGYLSNTVIQLNGGKFSRM